MRMPAYWRWECLLKNSERWEKVLRVKWDRILESLGNQNRKSGPEIIGKYIFVSKAVKET